MHILIIGAAGMVGRKLTSALVASGQVGGNPIGRLTLADVVVPQAPAGFTGKVETLASDLSAPGAAAALTASRPTTPGSTPRGRTAMASTYSESEYSRHRPVLRP